LIFDHKLWLKTQSNKKKLKTTAHKSQDETDI